MPPFAANQDIEELQHEELHLRARRPGGADRHGHDRLGPRSPARISKTTNSNLIDQTVKKGDAIIAVRLVHKPDGKPVPDAVIFATRLDMAPDGMQEMATKIAPMPSAEPGVYKFKATLTMAGGLAAFRSARRCKVKPDS